MKIDPIAGIATAQGQGGIGVIRVSGKGSIEIVEKLFKSVSGKKLKDLKGYSACFGKIFYKEEDIDDVIVLVFRNPHSYTGEDVVEISCHGGLYITQKILRLVIEEGARPAEPGEFTKRAFLNGKIDLIKAESVMKIIGATGKSAAKAAVAVNNGAISKKIEEIKQELIEISANLSVWADYPEDESIEVEVYSIKEKLCAIKEILENLKDNYDTGKVLINGVKTAIIGAPNVGKSTLMNMLSGIEKSIVTSIPGTTRDIVEETINLGDITLLISDTAGIRSTEDVVEAIGVNRARDCANSADIVLIVFDGSKNLSDEEKNLINFVKDNKVIAVVNKIDLDKNLSYDYIKKYIKEIVEISAQKGIGKEKLQESIKKLLCQENLDPSEGILMSERQYLSVKNAIKTVEEAIEAQEKGLTFDAITVLINDALNGLFEMTGEKATEKVVEEIFSKFCVGK